MRFILVENRLCSRIDVGNRIEPFRFCRMIHLSFSPNCSYFSQYLSIIKVEMQPLATTQNLLKWIGLWPIDEMLNNSKRESAVRVIRVILLFAITLSYMVACAVFIVENISTDLEDCLFTFMIFIIYGGVIFTMIVGFLIRHQVPSIFEQFASIYQVRKFLFQNVMFIQGSKNRYFYLDENIDSMRFLLQVNSTCEWMWSIYREYVIGFNFILPILPCTSIVLSWLIKDELNVDNFYRPIKLTSVFFYAINLRKTHSR